MTFMEELAELVFGIPLQDLMPHQVEKLHEIIALVTAQVE